ncbi:hypothetical protein BJ912DRAFT_968487 [Pholiota molesta]|nr:hypothetical protein BJ912DRAFT_968487 [Pholiota molesta]
MRREEWALRFNLKWRADGETEAKTYGNATLPGTRTVDDTRSISTTFSKTCPSRFSEAGCRVVVNALLIHVASNLETHSSGVVIAPKCRAEDKLFEHENSFNALADYMLFCGDKIMRDRIDKSKAFAFSDPEIYKLLKCIIYETKSEDLFSPALTTSLPQAAMAAIIKAQGLQLKTFRGCVTSGKTVYWLEPISLGERHNPTVNLELILGLLRDWVEHGHDNHLRFFEYPM